MQVGSDVKRIARVGITLLWCQDGVSVIRSCYSSPSLMSDPTMCHCGGPNTTTMWGSINERIREVLQFMKTCGCTSVASFLVAMCDSWVHDIKHLTGIMLGSWGLATNLVEWLFAADNATPLFKLTYDSHMYILTRKIDVQQAPDWSQWHQQTPWTLAPGIRFCGGWSEELGFSKHRGSVPASSSCYNQPGGPMVWGYSRNCRLPCPFQWALDRWQCSWGRGRPLGVR